MVLKADETCHDLHLHATVILNSIRPQFTDLVAYINYAYVMYVKYFFNIFHTAQQAAII